MLVSQRHPDEPAWALEPLQGLTVLAHGDRSEDHEDRRDPDECLRLLMDALFEPPPEFLALDRTDLEALRDAVATLPLSET